MSRQNGIPDMRFINREIPIADVARALDLRFDGPGKLHCWHPERHKNGDRTASVGIRCANNTVKCFGCDCKPMGPIDLVMDVLDDCSPADAALWIAKHFDVPMIPAKRHVPRFPRPFQVGCERGLGLLIRSGLWARLAAPTRSIATVLMEFAERPEPAQQNLFVRLSYRAISRFSGVGSPNSIRNALRALSEIGLLVLPERKASQTLERKAAVYVLTPYSDLLWESAQAVARQIQQEIAAEIELRRRLRKEKLLSRRRN